MAKPMKPSTKIARAEGHGLNAATQRDMGLHTSKHFAGDKPPQSHTQRLSAPKRDDHLSDVVADAHTRLIGP